jgi:hypothetical protein
MAIDFPSPATAGDKYTYGGVTYTYTAQGTWQGGTTPPPPTVVPTAAMLNAGRLGWSGATGLIFRPYNGDSVRVNGVVHPIPSAGIPIPATGLTANTTYLVGLNAALAPVFATSLTHAPSAVVNNVGTEVLGAATGVDTLIGMIRTDAAGAFVDTPDKRYVASWFNPPKRVLKSAADINTSTTSTTPVPAQPSSDVHWVKFAGRSGWVAANGGVCVGTGAYYGYTYVWVDAVLATPGASFSPYYANYWGDYTLVHSVADLADGYHTASVYVATGGTSCQWNGRFTGEVE